MACDCDCHEPDDWHDDEDSAWAKEEPNCYSCADTGRVRKPLLWWRNRTIPCPGCNPSRFMAWRSLWSWRIWNWRRLITKKRRQAFYDEPPF